MMGKYIQKRPIKFIPLFKEKIWGGHHLASILNKKISSNPIGESWEISAISNDVSISIENQSLTDIIKNNSVELLGKRLADDEFPLLYKFIDANDNLSIQVHPDDKVVNGVNVRGKTECWYIVSADPGAKIIVGFKENVSSKIIQEAINTNTLSNYLDMIPIKAGDVLYIPAGTVHAIMGGTVIYELQESSDITYRLYDWGRVDGDGNSRELHIEDSIAALNFNADKNYLKSPSLLFKDENYEHYQRVACDFFNLEEYKLLKKCSIKIPEKDVFTVLTMIEGSVEICCSEGNAICNKGETVLIPSICQSDIEINCGDKSQFLYSYVPR